MAELVSIIIPVYNAEKTIHRCVNSVLNQTYKNIQVVLIDDGSTDCSLKLCEQIAEYDSRITVISKKNGGVSSARNCGIENSDGEYIMFLDSDDWFETDMVERYIHIAEESKADVIIGGLQTFSENVTDILIKEVPVVGYKDISFWEIICQSSEIFGYIGGKLFKKQIIDENVIRFNEKMYAQEDLDFCISYYKNAESFFLTDYVGYRYLYEPGKRVPPYCDFMRNQLKLLAVAENKCNLDSAAYDNIQQRICGYVYTMFYQADTKAKTYEAFKEIKRVEGLDDYLRRCKINGEKKLIVLWYLKGAWLRISRYFRLRRFIKKLVKRE